MPRIRHSFLLQKTQLAESAFQLQPSLFYPALPDGIYSLFCPRPYERNYGYPLIVWLHGQGSDERQLLSIMPKLSIQNYVAVAPRGVCMQIKGSSGEVKEGFGWPQTYEHILEVEQHIFDAIEAAAKKFHISSERIFLAGFDSGGTMALRVALSHPQYFAGIVSIGGAIPTCRRLLGNLPLARKLSIFLAAGRNSHQYPEDEVCENLRLLYAAGMLVTLRQYPCGHELKAQMLIDVNRWIMEQINSPNSTLNRNHVSNPDHAKLTLD
jgi:phospholipase/carboxylesterase